MRHFSYEMRRLTLNQKSYEHRRLRLDFVLLYKHIRRELSIILIVDIGL